ncbi:aminoacyl--tRNA ligase-related protein [Phenylobacterium sp.]|uniref:aminoacyl--tRNA ligase-related protein n=1 Tax=Phenylobacterium sp. TaxID=1871053 RepID=UPI003BAAE383
MLSLYQSNGLVHWTDREIRLREMMQAHFAAEVAAFLTDANPAWDIRRVEAPQLTPRELVSDAYGPEDIFFLQRLGEHDAQLVLRPETTPSTYIYMQHLLNSHARVKLPLCVWQAGKSFRREQDQVSKHMRLKEFWQMEFQCAYTADTANDYHAASLEPVRRMIEAMVRLPTRIAPSDRLPAYSEVTMDVEVDNGDKWMEVSSISRRTDFPQSARFATKGGTIREVEVRVLEIAIGLDRCVYNWGVADAR